MKLLLILLILNCSLFASELDKFAKTMNFERDYNKAIQKANHLNLPIMLVLTKFDCSWCRRFEKKTLSANMIKTRLNNEVIVIIVDKDLDKKYFPSQKYQTSFSPMVFFIDPKKDEVLLESYGYVKKDDFMKVLDKVKKGGRNNMFKNLVLVTITITSLYGNDWLKITDSVIDKKHHLQWQDTADIEETEDIWKMRKAHCIGLHLLGFTNWRLPTKNELLILARSKEAKKLFSHLKDQVFWSINEDSEDDLNALIVYIPNGHISATDKCDQSYSICVRSE